MHQVLFIPVKKPSKKAQYDVYADDKNKLSLRDMN